MQIRRHLTAAGAAIASLALIATGALVAAAPAQAVPCPAGTTSIPSPGPSGSVLDTPCNVITVAVDAPAAIGNGGDWNEFEVTITNDGEDTEYFGEGYLTLLLRFAGNIDLDWDNLSFEYWNEEYDFWDWTSPDVEDGEILTDVEVDHTGLEPGESITTRFRIRAADYYVSGGGEGEQLTSLDLTALLFDEVGETTGPEDAIGNGAATIAVSPLPVAIPTTLTAELGKPVVAPVKITNSTGSSYRNLLTLPLAIPGFAPFNTELPAPTVKRLAALAAELEASGTKVEFKYEGDWYDFGALVEELMALSENEEVDPEAMEKLARVLRMLVIEDLPAGATATRDWRFTFTDSSLKGAEDLEIGWVVVRLDLLEMLDTPPNLTRGEGVRGPRASLVDPIIPINLTTTALTVIDPIIEPVVPETPVDDPADDDTDSGTKDKDGSKDTDGNDDGGDEETGGAVPAGLADTGANSNEFLALSAVLLIAGAAVVIGTRRRLPV